jgi:hypothetical protein
LFCCHSVEYSDEHASGHEQKEARKDQIDADHAVKRQRD